MLRFLKGSNRSRPRPTKPPARRPTLEVLEDRTLLASFIPGDLYVSARSGSISVGQVAPNGSVTSLTSGLDLTCLAFSPSGNLFVASPETGGGAGGQVYEVSPTGVLSLFVTLPSDNNAGISHMTFDSSGNMYVTNWQISGVNKVTPAGVISTYATGIVHPTGLTFDGSGNLYVSSETPNGYINKVTPDGTVSTFATGFHYAEGLAFDGSGNLYVANSTYGNDTSSEVDKIAPSGVVSTFATGFNHPQGIAFDGSGNLYVAEYWSGTVSRVGPAGGTATLFATGFAGTESIAFPPTAAVTATGVNVTATAGAPFTGVVATFTATPAAGTVFQASITLGDGSVSAGTVTITGPGSYSVSGTNTYADAGSFPVSVLVTDAYGDTATAASTATVTSLGIGVQEGQTRGIGFWHGDRGQDLIGSFNGGPASTALSSWLATSFPNLYGANAGSHNLTGQTNAQVAAFFQALWVGHHDGPDVQVLATAINVYATTASLGGVQGQASGFLVTAEGLGASSFDVGKAGAAFGVTNGTTLNVYQLLKAVDRQAVNGVLYNGDPGLGQLAENLFERLNRAGN